MDRYCKLMDVGSPQDLPASYPKREDTETISVSAARVVGGGYKGRVPPDEETHLAMTPYFTTEEWTECKDYARRLDRYWHDSRGSPGPAPPRYSKFCSALRSSQPYSPPQAYAPIHHHSYGPQHPNHSTPMNQQSILTGDLGVQLMSTKALNTMFSAQYKVMQFMMMMNRGVSRNRRPHKPRGKPGSNLPNKRQQGKPPSDQQPHEQSHRTPRRGRGVTRGRYG